MSSRGQVYQRKDRPGFYARFRHHRRYLNRGGFLTEEAAGEWIHAERLRLEREELLGVPTVRAEVTFGRFLPIWRKWAEGRWSESTLASAVTLMERVLLPELRDRPLGRITSAELGELLDDLETRRGLSGATRNRYMCVLGSVFRVAVRRGYARDNPVRGVERGKETVRAMSYLGPDEEARLLAALPGWLRVPFLVALDGGLRAGEVGALTRRSVDLGRGVLTVTRSKNRRPRSVGMTTRLRAALEAHLLALPKGQELLFIRPADGKSISGQTYRSSYTTAVDRAGLGGGADGGRFRFHDARHMAGVRLAEAGATPGEIKAFLGHKCLAATLRYLDHSPRDAALNAGRLLDQRLRARGAGTQPGGAGTPPGGAGGQPGGAGGEPAQAGGGPVDDHGAEEEDHHGPKKSAAPVDDHRSDGVNYSGPGGDTGGRKTA